ncbi:MAG: hypothetical protein IKO03_16510 [Lachnospiraceae bacterium]|nr:hypothetical protein [Lachnospiraceae bacterium]
MYYFKNIQIFSGKETVSILPLSKGLNIIYGPSNTGKSLVCECLDFLFGGEAPKLKKPVLKVKAVKGVLDVDGEELTIFREIDSKIFEVSGQVKDIRLGSYTTGNGSKKTPPINKLWLRLMGINTDGENVKIFQFQNGKAQSLTLRTFVHTFLINETRLGADNSILKGGDGYSKNIPVATIASLAYLATENNYDADKEIVGIDAEIYDARKVATQKLIDRSMSALAEKSFASLQDTGDKRSVDEIQQDINNILRGMESTEGLLNEAIEKSNALGQELISADDKIAECMVLQNRFNSLESQYESDIRRLTFIAEGEIQKDHTTMDRCPFCNGELSERQSESCVEAAVAEVEHIQAKMIDLASAKNGLTKELDHLNERRESLLGQRRMIQNKIKEDLRPKVSELRNRLIAYSAALERAKAEEMRKAVVSILNEKMEEIIDEETVAPDVKFDVRAVIKDFLKSPMEDHLNTVLESSHYENFVGARFDEDTCDVVVNGSSKMSQGQGYRAFLNTAVAIALQETLDGYNLHRLPLMVADSPIMSLKEAKEDDKGKLLTESMKGGLFQYMIDHCQSRQTIIMENSIPPLDYKNTNMIHFTKDESKGIYGLIKDYRE